MDYSYTHIFNVASIVSSTESCHQKVSPPTKDWISSEGRTHPRICAIGIPKNLVEGIGMGEVFFVGK